MTTMTEKPKNARESMVPSIVIAMLIAGALLGVVSAIFMLNVATTVCVDACDPNVHYTVVNLYNYLTVALFVAATILSYLLRHRRWWLAIPAGAVAAAVLLAVLLGAVAR